MAEEFVEDFTSNGELTPIDIVSDITGLTCNEIRSSSKIVTITIIENLYKKNQP